MTVFIPGSTISGGDRISTPLSPSRSVGSTQSGRERRRRGRRRRSRNTRRQILGSQNPSIMTLNCYLLALETTTKTQAKTKLEFSIIRAGRILRWHSSVVIPGHRRHGLSRTTTSAAAENKLHEKGIKRKKTRRRVVDNGDGWVRWVLGKVQ